MLRLDPTTRPLRAAIDGRALGSGWGGEETYLRALLAGLATNAADGDLYPVWVRPDVAIPPEIETAHEIPVRRIGSAPGPWHYAVRLPRAVRRSNDGVDVLCSTTHAPLRSSVPTAFIIGDLSPFHHPEWFPRHTALRLRAAWPVHARQAAAVLVPSEFTRADVIDRLRVPAERVFVVPPHSLATAGHAADAEALLRASGIRRPFVLSLGNLHPRKNVARLIRAFVAARADPAGPLAEHELVIAGGTWWRDGEERRLVESAPAGSVRMLGRVPDALRDALLARATAVAYLSLFEGFGLPPIEAMAAGTPVLVSTAAALPETCGDGAAYVDPLDVDAIAAALVDLCADDSLRATLVERGRVRAASFTAELTGSRAREALAFAAGSPR
jgi:glycosyltransferase involved in cell wall biosynthesis